MGRHLRFFLQCLFLVAYIAVLPLAVEAAQIPRSVDLVTGEQEGSISYVARGRGVASGAMIELTVTNLTNEPLEIVLPWGTRFVPEELPDDAALLRDKSAFLAKRRQGGSQGAVLAGNMAREGSAADSRGLMMHFTGRPVRALTFVALQKDETQTLLLEAYCINAHLDNPTADVTFRAVLPESDDLTKLAHAHAAQPKPASVIAVQIAVWIITDDVDMAFLESVGYGPTDQELREALLLLQDANIDISGKKMGTLPLPPASIETPVFRPGETKPVHIRGALVSATGQPLEGVVLSLLITGPNSRETAMTVLTRRARFDMKLDLYDTDTLTLILMEQGQEIGRAEYSASELYDLDVNGGELILTLGSSPPPSSSDPILFEITIMNHVPCDLTGSIGSIPFTVASGTETTVSVPPGTYRFSASGSCGSLPPESMTVEGNMTITLGE